MFDAGRDLLNQVAKLEAAFKQRTIAPSETAVDAAVTLYRQIKEWSPETRKMIDALDHKVSGDLGDFLIAFDSILKTHP